MSNSPVIIDEKELMDALNAGRVTFCGVITSESTEEQPRQVTRQNVVTPSQFLEREKS